MPVYFDTRDYRLTYGHEPRGRGSWAFIFGGSYGHHPQFFPSSTYAEARKLARAEAKRIGVSDVTVCT